MSLLFSDRFRGLKLGAAAALFVGLCYWAHVRIGPEYPPLGVVALYGDRWRDKVVGAQGHSVLAHAPDGFDMESRDGPLRIVTPLRPAVGTHVSVVGRVEGNRRIEAMNVKVDEGWAWKRPLNYGVSIATVLMFLWLIRGRFRIRLAEGLFRSRC